MSILDYLKTHIGRPPVRDVVKLSPELHVHCCYRQK